MTQYHAINCTCPACDRPLGNSRQPRTRNRRHVRRLALAGLVTAAVLGALLVI